MTQSHGTQSFSRSQYIIRPEARRREPLPSSKVTIRAPQPLSAAPEKPSLVSALPRVMGVFVMGMVVLGGLLFSTSDEPSATLPVYLLISPLLSGLMAAMTVGVQFWQYRSARREHETAVTEREQEYCTYLEHVHDQLDEVTAKQSRVLRHQDPPVSEMVKRVEKQKRRLWERLPDDNDFLALRIGVRDMPLCVSVVQPDIREEDPLQADVTRLTEQFATVPKLPLTTNLVHLGTVGLRSHNRETALQLVNTVVAHLVTHHSPDNVHLYLISHHPDAPRQWAWVRWLPHTNTLHGRDGVVSRLSFVPAADDDVLSALAQQLRRRDQVQYQRSSFQYGQSEPHILVIFDTVPDLMRHQVIYMLLGHKPNHNENRLRASALFIDSIPPQVNAQIQLRGDKLEYRETWMADSNQVRVVCKTELTPLDQVTRLARQLAPYRTDAGLSQHEGGLPGSVRLVELLAATRPLEVDLENLYAANYDPQTVMAFPIGKNIDLRPEVVILREDGRDGYGHHAMLAGMTGKGKSVTLQSIVLSLAANNPPTHLNFVLADFKGGTSLSFLQSLPHVVGFTSDIIENDEAAVERFRLALEGEVKRRKMLFDQASQNIDRQIENIYEYNEQFSNNLLPHLVVVIDEFKKGIDVNPELKQTLDKDIAAQGRALGIHLILSTQKALDFLPVRPNIEVRMSMQVQSSEDSRAIFDRDDAFRNLKRAGQAYLQVGNNKIFEMFQVARADIPNLPEEATNLNLLDDFTIRRLGPDGRRKTIYRHQSTVQEDNGNGHLAPLSEGEVLVGHIRDYCRERYKPPRMICLPPLPEADQMPLFDLLGEEPLYCLWTDAGWDIDRKLSPRRLKVPLGLLDLPEQQEQRPLILDLNQRDGHVIVAGPAGSGKSMYLRSAVLGLAAAHPPDDLLFYFLSRSATLSIFDELPHCQALIQPSEQERINRLFGYLEQEASRRAQQMRNARCDSMEALRGYFPDQPLPSLLVVFDDFAGFVAENGETAQVISRLASRGKQVDIHFIYSVTSMRGSHAKYVANTLNRLALGVRLGSDTLEILGKRTRPLKEIAGRGYIQQEQEVLEVQIAAPSRSKGLELHSQEAVDEIQAIAAAMNERWVWPDGRRPLPPITELPAYLELETLWQEYVHDRRHIAEMPTATLGLDYNSMEPVTIDVSQLQAYSIVTGPARSGKTDFLLTLCLSAAVNLSPSQVEIFVLVLERHNPLRLLRDLPHIQLGASFTRARKLLTDLHTLLTQRMEEQQVQQDQTMVTAADMTRVIPKQTLIVVDDLQQFSHFDDLSSLLDKCMDLGRHLGIHLFVSDTSIHLNQVKQNFGIKYIQAASKYGSGVAFSVNPGDLTLLNQVGKISNPIINSHRAQMGKGRAVFAHDSQLDIVQFGRLGDVNLSSQAYENNIRRLVEEIAAEYTAAASE
ncbi:MAG: hypothetical protein GY796_01100 [Chloroflexi bacterium]|nr:hypothetical protein [Chloroflexota bacterium]